MFTIRNAASPVLFTLVNFAEDCCGQIIVYGSACGGVFKCEIDLDDMIPYGQA